MPPLSAYSSGIFGITWSPPDPRTRESNAARYFASVNPDWSAAFDFYIQNCKSSVAARSPQVIWALHRLSKLSSSIQHMATKCLQQWHGVCERGHKKKSPDEHQHEGSPDGSVAKTPSPFLLPCVSVCAARAEAGIDTIHHECKWAAWFDISNKPVSMYQWV